jgi:hypothetical protein
MVVALCCRNGCWSVLALVSVRLGGGLSRGSADRFFDRAITSGPPDEAAGQTITLAFGLFPFLGLALGTAGLYVVARYRRGG